jgi:hypothetical protein
VFAAKPPAVLKKRPRGKKVQHVPLSDRGLRRSTRSSAAKDGHRHVSLPDTGVRAKKKRRVLRTVEELEASKIHPEKLADNSEGLNSAKAGADAQENCTIPATPIVIIQKVGMALGIDADELTREKLMADPKNKAAEGKFDDE